MDLISFTFPRILSLLRLPVLVSFQLLLVLTPNFAFSRPVKRRIYSHFDLLFLEVREYDVVNELLYN